MNGIELCDFMHHYLVIDQVLYISNVGGRHTFTGFLNNPERLQFAVPNNINPNNPQLKSIQQNIIENARDLYIQDLAEYKHFIDAITEEWHHDCRVRILGQLVKLPDYLDGA
jgi:hypothetical protein